MIKKDITICGKQVTLGYCYATEIAYNKVVGEDVLPFIQESVKRYEEGQGPDRQKTVAFIIASAVAYYQSIGEESPIEADDLLYNANAQEFSQAAATVFELYKEFYEVAPNDKAAKRKGQKRKNA